MKSLIALTLALATLLAYVGPSLDDHRGESPVPESAIAEHQAEIRMLRAAVEMCGGQNAVAQDLGNGTVQCLTKRGHKTIVVKASK